MFNSICFFLLRMLKIVRYIENFLLSTFKRYNTNFEYNRFYHNITLPGYWCANGGKNCLLCWCFFFFFENSQIFFENRASFSVCMKKIITSSDETLNQISNNISFFKFLVCQQNKFMSNPIFSNMPGYKSCRTTREHIEPPRRVIRKTNSEKQKNKMCYT